MHNHFVSFSFIAFLLILLNSCSDNSGNGTIEPSIIYPINESSDDYIFDNTKVTTIQYNPDGTVTIVGAGANASGSKVTIMAGGQYSIKGTTMDGQLLVESGDTNTVKIVLDGVNITSKTSSAIYIKAAKKAVIILADGTENFLADAASYIFDDAAAQEPSGVIFSKEDITFYGNGALNINSNFQDGIVSKDGIIIKSGKIKVSAVDDAIRGKNYVVIRDGTIDLTAQQDGLKSSGSADEGLGFIIIDKGTINITAADDGIHGEYYITINNGKVNVIKSYEAIEARRITLNGGEVNINATNDGFNCSDGVKNSANALSLFVNGGSHVARVSKGDVYDSNGSINIAGGTIVSHGPISGDGEALDHDGQFIITGGTVIGTGGQIRSDFVGSGSTQNILAVTMSNANQKPLVRITNSSGKDLIAFQVENGMQSFVFSSPAFSKGDYSFVTGGTLTSGINNNGLIQNPVVTGGSKLFDFGISGLVTILKK